MASQQSGEELCLSLTQLRELRRHVRDRTVMLADLVAVWGGADRGSVPVGGQRPCQCVRPLRGGCRRDPSGHPVLDLGPSAARKVEHRVVAAGLGEEAQRAHGQVVVALLECVPTRIGHPEVAGGSAAAASARRGAHERLGAWLDVPIGRQVVEMAAHSGGGQSERLGELSSAGRAAFEQHAHDTLAGGCLTMRVAACGPRGRRVELHNTSVPLLPTVHNRRGRDPAAG